MNAPTDKSLAEQAAELLRRLDDGTPQAHVEFVNWLRESPAHVREMLIAIALEHELRGIFTVWRADPHRRLDIQRLLRARTNVRELFDWTAPPDSDDMTSARTCVTQRMSSAPAAAKRRPWYVGAIACFVALFTAATAALHATAETVIITRAGEWQTKTLNDGTIVRVGPRTQVDVHYTSDRLHLRLARGEALFHVANNPARPFIVETELASATALGTVFAMSIDEPGRVRVTVEKGTVAVTSSSATGRGSTQIGATSIALKAGDEIVATASGLLALRQVNVEEALAWAKVRLSFHGDPLARVLQEFNRRNALQLKVVDQRLLMQPVTGTFDASDPQAIASYLEQHGAVCTLDTDAGILSIAPYPDPIAANNPETRARR